MAPSSLCARTSRRRIARSPTPNWDLADSSRSLVPAEGPPFSDSRSDRTVRRSNSHVTRLTGIIVVV
jgi:hypothetical protein